MIDALGAPQSLLVLGGTSDIALTTARRMAADRTHRIVLAGRPSLRTPEGWRELAEGELVAFPRGERGAHQVVNRSDADVRMLVISEMNAPELSVYPDSGKVAAFAVAPGSADEGLRALFRLTDEADYWEGESQP